VIVWRLARAVYPPLDGEGARRVGGRWNPPGVPMVYASGSLALAALEYTVNVHPDDAPADLIAFEIAVPDDLPHRRIANPDLPADWQRMPAPPACAELGARWAREKKTAVLLIPSVVVPDESNVLINPVHPDTSRIRIASAQPFTLDPRLLDPGLRRQR